MKKIITAITLATAIIASPILYRLVETKFLTQKKENLSVRAQVLVTKQELTEAFGQNEAANLQKTKGKRKLEPIKLDIKNNQDKTITTSLVATDLNIAPKGVVTRKLKGRSGHKVFALGAGILVGSALLAWSIFSADALIYQIPECIAVYCTPAAGIIAGTGALASIPAMTVYSSRSKTKRQDSAEKLVGSKRLTLEAGQTKSIYLFVRQPDYKNEFSLTFSDGMGNNETVSCHCARQLS